MITICYDFVTCRSVIGESANLCVALLVMFDSRIGNCDCCIDSGGNCVDYVISQKSSLKTKKHWTHHKRKYVYDVSNFFIKLKA